ncbi:MAG: hypothetical protein GY768_29200 [Planctomycetaceae bacterium]|nr:hypothetical protein [Planctomycetaceae bacterium]
MERLQSARSCLPATEIDGQEQVSHRDAGDQSLLPECVERQSLRRNLRTLGKARAASTEFCIDSGPPSAGATAT